MQLSRYEAETQTMIVYSREQDGVELVRVSGVTFAQANEIFVACSVLYHQGHDAGTAEMKAKMRELCS